MIFELIYVEYLPTYLVPQNMNVPVFLRYTEDLAIRIFSLNRMIWIFSIKCQRFSLRLHSHRDQIKRDHYFI